MASSLDNISIVEGYMALYQHDENSIHFWIYYKRIIEWEGIIFPQKRNLLKGLEWCLLYNDFKDATIDPD